LVDTNTVAISGSLSHNDTVFMVYDNTDPFEGTCFSGFTFVDVNVDP
jgi:hypothetical protein